MPFLSKKSNFNGLGAFCQPKIADFVGCEAHLITELRKAYRESGTNFHTKKVLPKYDLDGGLLKKRRLPTLPLTQYHRRYRA